VTTHWSRHQSLVTPPIADGRYGHITNRPLLAGVSEAGVTAAVKEMQIYARQALVGRRCNLNQVDPLA
jgi:hypothetical protein